MDLKTRSHWLLGYGLARATLKLLARRGDAFAQLVTGIKYLPVNLGPATVSVG